MSTAKKISIAVISVVLAAVIAVVAVLLFKNDNSMFKDNADSYTLTQEYVLSDADVKATDSSDKVVSITKAVTFDLGGYALDLNGYTLKIASNVEGALVTVKNGTVENGSLVISVPNGDIDFDNATIAENVEYELEAASQTIRFSNVKSNGKGTVKSDTHIQISYSEMADIALAGNGSLEAGEGTKLGKLSVNKEATGAKVVIAPTAKVTSLAVSAKADINIAGTVDDVEIKAVAKVEVTGAVKKVSVTSEASSETETAEIKIAASASVDNVDLKGKTNLEVQGVVANVVVAGEAVGTKVVITGDQAVAGRVVINAENTVVEDENNAIQKVLVSTEVADKVELGDNINAEIVEDVTELEKVHNYAMSEEKASTCSEEGYKVYKCTEENCEDGYTVTIPKKPHNIEESIIKLPSQISTGIKGFTCSECGYHYETKIPALKLESDSLYQLICLVLGDKDMTFSVSEDAKISIYEESTNYDYATGMRSIISIKVAKASINIKDGMPTGFMNFEVVVEHALFDGVGDIKTFASEDAEELVVSFSLYINEGVVYVQFVENEEVNNATIGLNILDQILIQQTNGAINADTIFKAIEVYNFTETAFENYVPFVEAVKEALNSKEDANVGGLLVALFDEYLIKEEEIDGNILYSLDVNGLTAFTDKFATATLADVIEGKFGEGTVDNLVEKIKALPTLTVKEIADYAIAIAEEYKFDVDYTFDLIETYVQMIAGVEIDIQTALEEVYDVTIIDMILATMGSDAPGVEEIGGNKVMSAVKEEVKVEVGTDEKVDAEMGEKEPDGEKEPTDEKEPDIEKEPTDEKEEIGGEQPVVPTKEEIIAMFEQGVDGVASIIKTCTIDELFAMLMPKAEARPEGGEPGVDAEPEEGGEEVPEEPFVLSAFIKENLQMISQMAIVEVLVGPEGNVIAIQGALFDGTSIVYMVDEGAYTITAYYGMYEVKIDYTVETKNAIATVSVFDPEASTEETNVYAPVYFAELALNGEEFKYSLVVKTIVEEAEAVIAEAKFNYATDENGKVEFKGIVNAMGYTIDTEISEADLIGHLTVLMGEDVFAEVKVEDTETGKLASATAMGYTVNAEISKEEQTGSIAVLMGENVFAEVKLENTETGKLATVMAMGYKAELDWVTGAKTVKAIVYTFDGETSEFVEWLSLEYALEGEDFDFKAVAKMADQVMAEIIANWDKTDVKTIFNATGKVMGYDVAIDADSETETATLVVSMGEGEDKIEHAKVEIANDEETGIPTATIFYQGERLGSFGYKGTDSKDFNTKFDVEFAGNSVAYDFKVETLAENKYKLSIYAKTSVEGEDVTEKLEYVIEFVEAENANTVKLDTLITMGGSIFGEESTMLDGEFAYTITNGEAGNIEKIDVSVDLDRFQFMVDSNQVSGVILNTITKYAEADFDISFDFTKSEEVNKEDIADIAESMKRIETLKFGYDDGIVDYSTQGHFYNALAVSAEFKKAENGSYIEVKERGVYTHNYEIIEYVALIPVIDGCYLPNGGLAISDICKDWVSISLMAQVEATVYKYENEQPIETGEIVNKEIDFYLNYNVVTGEVRRGEEGVHDYEITTNKFGDTCQQGYEATYDCKNCEHEYTQTYYECVHESTTEVVGETLCSEHSGRKVELHVYKCICCGDEYSYIETPCSMSHTGNEPVEAADLVDLGIDATNFYEGYVDISICYYCHAIETTYTLGFYDAANDNCYTLTHIVFSYEGQLNENTNEYDYEAFEVSKSTIENDCLDHNEHIGTIYFDDGNAATETENAKYLSYLRLVFGEDLVKFEDLWVGSAYVNGCDACGKVEYVELSAITAYKISTYNYTNFYFDFTLYFENGEFEYARIDSYDNASDDWDERIFMKIVEPYITELKKDYNFTADRTVGVMPNGNIYANGDMDLTVEFTMKKQDINGKYYNDKVNVYINSIEGYVELSYYDVYDCETKAYVCDLTGKLLGVKEYKRHGYTTANYTETGCCSEESYTLIEVCEICDEVTYSDTYSYHRSTTYTYGDLNDEYIEGDFCATTLNANGYFYGWRCDNCDKYRELHIELYDDWTLTNNVYIYAEDVYFNLNGYSIDLNGYNLIIYSIAGRNIVLTNENSESEGVIDDSVGTGYLVLFSDSNFNYGKSDITVSYVIINCEQFMSDVDSRSTIADSFYEATGNYLSGYYSNFN